MEFVEKNEIMLPKIGLGIFSMSKETLECIIPESIKMGYCLFDTAHKYQNEEFLGKILKRYNGSKVYIETKVHPTQLLGNIRYLRLNRKSIASTYRQSCHNLQVSSIDVFMIHGIMNGYEKYLAKLLAIKHKTGIGLAGICNINLEQLTYLNSCFGILPDIVQVEIHPYHSNKNLIDYCKKHSVLIQARSPFAHGDAFEEWQNEDVLKVIAKRHGATIPQIILRWITQQDIIAICRSTSISHLQDNINSLKLRLSEEEIFLIDSLNKNKSYGFTSSKDQ